MSFSGSATAAFIGFLLQSGMTEARTLLAQKTPDAVSVSEAASLRSICWIRVTDPAWHCDRAITIERRPGFERWMLGPIEQTEVPITGTTDGDVVIARFDGAVSCVDRAREPLSGVSGSTEIFTSRATMRRWRGSGGRVVVLNVGASPRDAMVMMIGLMAIAALGLGFGAFHLVRMLPRREARANTDRSYAPLEPR